MMSRACAGLVAGRIVVSLPGSEAAVRLAMERLRRSRSSAHLVQQAAKPNVTFVPMRPFTSTISLDEARRRLRRRRASDRPDRARARSKQAAGRVAAADVTSAIDVPPFARSAMDGYAVVAADTASASATAPVELALARSHLHRPDRRR